MNVLITGGMGVIGAFAVGHFVQSGINPVLYSRHRDERLIGPWVDDLVIELGDVLDLPRLMDVVQSHDVSHIVHNAALTGALSQANPHQSVQINIVGTANLLEVARQSEVRRFIYASAKGVYGHVDGRYGHPEYLPLPEDYRKEPARIYDATKLAGEHIGRYYSATYGIEFAALRFATTYGPGKMARHGAMAVTSAIVEQPYAGKPFKIERGGDQVDDFIYNADAGRAIYLATTATRLRYDAYNIGTGVGATLRDFAAAVRSNIPNADIQIGPGLDFLGQNVSYHAIYDTARAGEDLDFKAEYDLERGVADYVQRLSEMGNDR